MEIPSGLPSGMSSPTNLSDELVVTLLRGAIRSELAHAELFNLIAEGAAARGDFAEQEWAADIADESAVAAAQNVVHLLTIDSPRAFAA